MVLHVNLPLIVLLIMINALIALQTNVLHVKMDFIQLQGELPVLHVQLITLNVRHAPHLSVCHVLPTIKLQELTAISFAPLITLNVRHAPHLSVCHVLPTIKLQELRVISFALIMTLNALPVLIQLATAVLMNTI